MESARPTALAGHAAFGCWAPRYTAWRSKRTHAVGFAAVSVSGHAAGTLNESGPKPTDRVGGPVDATAGVCTVGAIAARHAAISSAVPPTKRRTSPTDGPSAVVFDGLSRTTHWVARSFADSWRWYGP